MVKMKKVLVLGAFGYFSNQLDGQTIKTRNVFNLLEKNYSGTVLRIDTLELRKKPILVFKLFWYLISCATLVIIPCLNNLTFIFPITYYLSKVFRYKIIHICIGGWQVEYFKGNERFAAHPLQLRLSKNIQAFMPEMKRVKEDLKAKFGFTNLEVLQNFRDIDTSILNTHQTSTLKLVFLARVNRMKGYVTIFNLAEYIKEKGLDITITFYGAIDKDDKDDFYMYLSKYSDYVTYGGLLQQEVISQTLVNYDIMLFPTKYYTEGLPGTIIDAYTANLPVIATQWKHANEFIIDGKTGFIVPFDNSQDIFNAKILELYKDRAKLAKMKMYAKEEALRFTEETAWKTLSKYL